MLGETGDRGSRAVGGRQLAHFCASVAGAVIALFAFVPGAGATVTLGSPLTTLPDAGISCGTPPCSLSQSALPGRMLSSPVNGTVTRWGVWLSAEGPSRLRVIRPVGAGALFLSSSATETLPGGGDPAYFATSIPISIGDRIAQDYSGIGPGNPNGVATPGATIDGFDPTPADGAPGAATPATAGVELALSADIEPTNLFAIVGVASQKKKGTATLTATLPNPGVLAAAGPVVKPATATVASPGDTALKLVPAKSARKRLKRKGKAGGAVTLTFTPSFGTASTQSVRVELRRKKR